MKKSIILLFIILPLMAMSQTQINNSSFETWTTSQPIEATPWKCNIPYVFMSINVYIPTATKTTDAQSGQYAAKLETKTQYGLTVPGLIQLGTLSIGQNFDINLGGGFPFTDKPTGISFYMKYLPANNDTAWFIATLTKFNSQTNQRDTLGGFIFFFKDLVQNYEQQVLPILYYDDTQTPDTINIMFVASSFVSPQIGSVFYIDNVELLYSFYPFPTIALPATNLTSNSFDAHWISSPYSNKYVLDVAKDVNFTNFVEGFQNLEIINNIPFDSITDYTVVLPANTSERDFYYRVLVNYGDSLYSIASNPVKVTLPNAQNINTIKTISFYSFNKTVVIDNVENYSNVEVYNLSGVLINSQKINSNTLQFQVKNSGIYIVKLITLGEAKTIKVFVK